MYVLEFSINLKSYFRLLLHLLHTFFFYRLSSVICQAKSFKADEGLQVFGKPGLGGGDTMDGGYSRLRWLVLLVVFFVIILGKLLMFGTSLMCEVEQVFWLSELCCIITEVVLHVLSSRDYVLLPGWSCFFAIAVWFFFHTSQLPYHSCGGFRDANVTSKVRWFLSLLSDCEGFLEMVDVNNI